MLWSLQDKLGVSPEAWGKVLVPFEKSKSSNKYLAPLCTEELMVLNAKFIWFSWKKIVIPKPLTLSMNWRENLRGLILLFNKPENRRPKRIYSLPSTASESDCYSLSIRGCRGTLGRFHRLSISFIHKSHHLNSRGCFNLHVFTLCLIHSGEVLRVWNVKSFSNSIDDLTAATVHKGCNSQSYFCKFPLQGIG